MRRLLLVLNDPIDFHANRLALALGARAAGWEVHVAAPAEPAWRRIADDGWPFHAVDIDRLGMRPHREARAVASLAALYRRLRPQVVHLRAIKPILAGGLAARRVGGIGVLAHFCGLGFVFTGEGRARRLLRSALRPALRRALSLPRQRVVVQNGDDGAALLAAGVVARGRLRLIPGSGVDTRLFRPAPAATGVFTVVLPARLLRAKGIAEYAEAGRILSRRGVAARLVVIGPAVEGNADAIDAVEMRRWCAEGVIAWQGASADMPASFAAAHCVCLPSWREGLPKALLEGAASGLPLVATDVPGCRAAVIHGVTGLLVPPRDPVALADAIARLAGDPELCHRLGGAARLRASSEFADTAIIGRFLALYDELCLKA